MLRHRSRFALGVAIWVLAVMIPAGSASAVDCVGPDDPPGCVTPAPVEPTPTPTPVVTPTPEPTPVVQVVQVDDAQYAPIMWGLGALLSVNLIALIGSWSK